RQVAGTLLRGLTRHCYRFKQSWSRAMVKRTSKTSEGRFQLAFENSPMGMAIVDFDYRMRRVNRALCTALGYEADELLKRKFIEITHPDDVQRDRELADKLFQDQIPFYRLEKRFITKQGTQA